MTKWNQIKLPNARFFYIKEDLADFDFHRVDSQLKEALAKASRLAPAHDYIDIYFDSRNNEVKYGREVIGYNPLAAQDQVRMGYDLLHMGQGKEILFNEFSKLSKNNLKEYFDSMALQFDKTDEELIRLRWCVQKSQANYFYPKSMFQILCKV